nr:type II toxin-antitoxin system death-on-curing family toxin [Saccharomonospora xinjiangensis]
MYLRADEVQQMNAHFVGPNALRDFGLLDGAVMRPQSSIFGEDAFPTLHEKAAALLHGIARNHPFIDGNKRTAWAATATFYLLNGHEIRTDQGDIVALVVDTAEGQLDVPTIAATLKPWAHPLVFPTA